MKILNKYYRQFSILLISFLFFNVIGVCLKFIEENESKTITSYMLFGLLCVLLIAVCLGYVVSKVLNKRFYFYTLLIYMEYLFFSYLLEISIHLTVPSYDLWNFKANHLFQLNSLIFIIPTLLLAIVFKYTPKLNNIKFLDSLIINEENCDILKTFFLSQVLLNFILLDSKTLEFLKQTSFLKKFIVNNKFQITDYFAFSLIGLLVYLTILLATPSFFSVKAIKDICKNKASFSVASLFSLLFAIIFNFTIQNSIRGDTEFRLSTGATSFQIIIFFAIFLVMYLIFNRFLISTIFISLIISGITIASSLKFQFRQEPILPSDIVWLKEPKLLLEFMNGFACIVYILLGLFVIVSLYIFFRKKILANKIIPNYKYRLSILILTAVLLMSIVGIFTNKKDGKIQENIPIISVLNNYEDLNWYGNMINARSRSLVFVWLSHLSDSTMYKPQKYSAEKIKAIEQKYQKASQILNKERTNKIEEQTVIYILSESFSDPTRVEGVKLSKNPISNIQKIKEQNTSGLMKSDGYGGGTANMEFQSLTGLPFYNLSPSISVAYTEVVPKMNKFPVISNLFEAKKRVAIHLAAPTNYSRNVIYKSLGYSKFISLLTKGLDVHYQGVNYSDSSTYQLIIDNMKDNQNYFFSVMTMQNHSPWKEEEPNNIEASNSNFSSDVNEQLTNYTRLLHHTDIATKDFLDRLSKINKKVTVVFYGDHLPGLYPQSAFKNNPESQYLTDYFVWSNYETPKLNYPIVNSSDFTALLLEQTNSKVSPYYALLTEVLHKASVGKKNLDAEGRQIAEELKLIQYDIVAGKGYLTKDFFKVQSE